MQNKADAEWSSALGLLLAIAVLGVAHVMNGGEVSQVLRPSAILVVLGGTLAALWSTFTTKQVSLTFRSIREVYSRDAIDIRGTVDWLIEVAQVARKEGLLVLEPYRAKTRDPLLQKMIKCLIDGFEAGVIREMIDAEIALEKRKNESSARVLMSAADVAPVVGVLGAVLGLLPVVGNLSKLSNVGPVLTTAFASVLYGLFAANIVFEPWSRKLSANAEAKVRVKEAIRTGILGIQEGVSPIVLKDRLEVFVES